MFAAHRIWSENVFGGARWLWRDKICPLERCMLLVEKKKAYEDVGKWIYISKNQENTHFQPLSKTNLKPFLRPKSQACVWRHWSPRQQSFRKAGRQGNPSNPVEIESMVVSGSHKRRARQHFSPPRFGKDYKWHISGIFPANWGIICYLSHLLGEPKTTIDWTMEYTPLKYHLHLWPRHRTVALRRRYSYFFGSVGKDPIVQYQGGIMMIKNPLKTKSSNLKILKKGEQVLGVL